MKTDQLKYGRIERERRFFLHEVPPLPFDRKYHVVDRYLVGTRLRLRRMEDSSGTIAYKLARKLPPHAPGAGIMGNLYLDRAEYELLHALPAGEIRKHLQYAGTWRIDIFEGPLEGLLLAEAEVETDAELAALKPPFSFIAEVTEKRFFSGGSLAACTRQDLLDILKTIQYPKHT